MALTFLFLTLFVLFAGAAAISESHTIRFDNQCGKGTPQLIIGGRVVSNGSDYTSQGPASSGIAYLQTGSCLFNGENCAIVEFTLGNPTCAGCGSSTDISLIAPHQLNVPTGFSYFNGCDGVGATCTTPECNAAFFNPNDNQVQVACQSNNVGLLISFCPNGEATPSSPSSSPSKPTVVPVSASVTAVSATSIPTEKVPASSSPAPSPSVKIAVPVGSPIVKSSSPVKSSSTFASLPTSSKKCPANRRSARDVKRHAKMTQRRSRHF